MAERILVAGAGGFIGAHITKELITRGHSVSAVVHREPAWRLAELQKPKVAVADLTVPGAADEVIAAARPRIVINAASYGVSPSQRDPERMFAVNVTAPALLLQASRAYGVGRFIQLGSCSEYGLHPGPVSEHTPVNPRDGYGATKAAASVLVATKDFTAPVEAIVLRLFNIWGPLENSGRLIPSVIASCRSGTPLMLTAGLQQKDYSLVSDVARWICDAALHPEPYDHSLVNVASGTMIAVKDLVTAVARRRGGEALMKFGAKPVPAAEAQTGPVDTTRLDALLPQRTITPLEEAVRATLEAAA